MRRAIAASAVCLLLAVEAIGQQQIASAPPPPPPAAPRTPPKALSPLERAAEEFKLQTRNLGLRAESAGAKANGSGPKLKWHGRLFENLRNDFFDAVPHQITQRGGTKSLLRRNQFGFNLAGPVVIPHLFNGARTTFFSVSYEGMRERISRSSLRTIPTMEERAGDFAATVDSAGAPLPLYDPLTTRENPGFDPSQPVSIDNLQYLRDVFPANAIPANRLDPKARATAALFPEPNSNAGPFFRNNYFVVSPETNTANGMILKLDHTISEHHRIEFAAALSNGFAGSARLLPSVADPSAPDHEFRSRRASLGHVFTVSPRTVNSMAFEATTDGSRNVADVFPYYSFDPYLPVGKINPLGRYARNNFTFSDGLALKRGKHSLRIYGDLMQQQVNSYYDWFPEGMFHFSSGLTSLPGIVNTGHSFASFLLGLSDSVELTRVTSPSYFQRARGSLLVRDQYELTPNLTLSGSLNFEVNQPRTEKYDRQSTVNFNVANPANGLPGALVAANRNGIGRTFQQMRGVWEPAVSLAWNPSSTARTVVRVDASRRYNAIPIYVGQFGTQGFNAARSYISENVQLAPAVTLEQGLPPLGALPDLRPDAVNDTVADYIEPSGRMPRIDSAGLSLERELPGAMTVSVGVSHAAGKNMLTGNWAVDLNAIPLDELRYRDQLNEEAFRRTLRPYPQYQSFDVNGLYPGGRFERDAGFVRVEKRSSRGLSLTATYEFTKQLDDYSGVGVQDYYNRDNEWSLTPFLNPHRFSMSCMYELPFGSGKSLLNFSDWRRYLVEGWSVSGMTIVNSGDPLVLRPQFNNTGGVVRYLHVDVVPGVDPHVPDPSADLWFNPAAFAQPEDFTIGNASRTHPSLLMPGSQNHDLSLTKRFSLDADRALELSAVGFNFLNHANLNDPDTVIGPTNAPNVNAGKIIGSSGGRVVQVGLRYSF